jgi:hypothetical protein
MIVRISGEGQYDVPDDVMDNLNELDATVEKALGDEDEATFRTALSALLDQVRASGTPVAVDVLEPSDLVLPHADSTLEEVQAALGEEGLIPG